jgi:hypothetical protein
MRGPFLLLVCLAGAGCAAEPVVPKGEDLATSSTVAGQSDAASESPVPDGIAIRFVNKNGQSAAGLFELQGMSERDLNDLSSVQLSAADWFEIFPIRVVTEGTPSWTDRPPVLGSYSIDGDRIQFKPAFPLEPGLTYRARFDLQLLYDRVQSAPGTGSSRPSDALQPVVQDFSVPRPIAQATTVVTHVFPTADTLPENQLKFYLHFSAPMSRGEAYRRVHLLDESGSEVELPFLDLDEELWDRQGRRFTLFLDPGRIKRGLKPREDVGPVFEEGKSYTLVIDHEWTDAAGNPLAQSFRKRIQVGPPDDQQPDPNNWKVTPPASASTEPLVIQFPEPLDHAMLHRVIVIHDSAERPVIGTVNVTDHETRWTLTPAGKWLSGDYTIEVQTDLEDLAGNSIARVFDVDLLEPISRTIKAERWSLPFRVE